MLMIIAGCTIRELLHIGGGYIIIRVDRKQSGVCNSVGYAHNPTSIKSGFIFYPDFYKGMAMDYGQRCVNWDNISAIIDIGYNLGYTYYMKTAISLPDPLFILAEETAKKLGVSRSTLFAIALEEYIKNHHPQKITRQLDDIYSKQESSLDKKVFEAQLLSIEEDW